MNSNQQRKEPYQISICTKCKQPVMSDESRNGYDHDVCPTAQTNGDKVRVEERHGRGWGAARE